MKIGYFVDWLEVYCIERKNIDIKSRLEELGYRVEVMPYTTRIYGQILQVYRGQSEQVYTICRLPLSVKSEGSDGILKAGSCHIKLHNHLLYTENVGNAMMIACKHAGVTLQSISRLDICADFQYFWNGLHPNTLIKGFAAEKYLKIGQPRFTLHGTTDKGYNIYNSVLFGSKNSNVYTRFYCKSLEMAEVVQKNWIVDRWRELGFDMTKQVWRVEFAIKAPGRKTLDRKTAEVKEIIVPDLCSRDKIRAIFVSLSKRYFVFTKADTATRKYNQDHLVLFDPAPEIERYSPLPAVHTNTTNATCKRTYNYLIKEAKDDRSYSLQERLNMWKVATNLASHHQLQQWQAWKYGSRRADMPIDDPVNKPINAGAGISNKQSETAVAEQKEIW